MEIRYKGNAKIFLIAFFGLLMVCLSYLIYFFNPLQLIVDQQIIIKDGSISFRLWETPPYDIKMKVYVFNVTNEDAFLSGEEKLRFEEVGPYVFKETLENVNPTFNGNGTLSFMPKRSVTFLRELSVSDPKTDYINTPNVPLLGIASMLHQRSMFLNLAVLSISRMLNSQAILNITVEDFFWGYEDKLVHMASQVLPNWISFQKFGILDRMYDEGNNTVTINVDPARKEGSSLIDKQERGRLYSILTWNGSPGLSQWGYQIPQNNETVESNSKCNMIEGAFDGTVFPPHITDDMVFRVYRKFACRPVPIELLKKGQTKDNYNANYYRATKNFLDPYEDNPDNECFCREKNFCLPRGLGDATPCYYGFPAAISKPHLLDVDPAVLEKIDGLEPSQEIHESEMLLSPELGLILKGYIRLQVNLVMWQTKYNSKTAPYNNKVLPLFWCEMSVDDIPSEIHLLMTLIFKVGPIAQTVVMYILAIVGAALIATAGILVFLSMGVTRPSSPGISLEYSPIRVVPIRRESCIADIRRWNK